MSQGGRHIRIANIQIPLPEDIEDADLIDALERDLQRAYDEEEKRIGRIDTPVIALSLAVRLALELQNTRDQLTDQEEEVRAILEKVASQIEQLAEEKSG